MFKFRKLAWVASALLIGSSAFAQYQKGPDPTASALERTGPFATTATTISSFSVSGFGGGRLTYPTSTSSGTYGAIVLCPGFTASASSLSWLGPRLASHGFVVLIIETNSRLDQPSSRASQLAAAARWLTGSSSVRGRIDASRVAVGGHSMGGGGTLEAARNNPQFKAAWPLAPWNLIKSFSTIRVPTQIIGGSADTVAPDSQHSILFYNSIPSSTPKQFIELRGASHFFPQSPDAIVSRYGISWFKRWVDEDTRYSQFLNQTPSSLQVSDFRRNTSF
jgi:alpha-beta hydrolase superfamily lysophospholipase